MSNLMMLAAAAAPVVDAPLPLLQHVSPVFLLLWAAALCAVTAVIHSVLGERKLIRPLVTTSVGTLIRFAWHWTSVLWLLVAALLAAAAYGDVTVPWLIFAVGAVHLVAGAADAIFTRGRHIGWPLITLIGALTLFSAYLTL